MLSRLASRGVMQGQSLLPRPLIVGVQKMSSAPAKEAPATPANQGLEDPLDNYPRIFATKKEGPERDLVNFPRPVMREHPGAVRLAFVPEEWFDFFYKKTGVTGPYMFGIGLWTWLLSKEIYVLEHNFYNGLSMFVIVAVLHNKLGPKIAAWADKDIEKWKTETTEHEQQEKGSIEEEIKHINTFSNNLDVYKDLMDAKRELAAAVLEATYREWLNSAYREAKKRLDFQLELANVERRIAQRNMSSWITESVLKSITPTQEQEALKKCIQDLKSLSAAV